MSKALFQYKPPIPIPPQGDEKRRNEPNTKNSDQGNITQPDGGVE
jgi:hypothetical protein